MNDKGVLKPSKMFVHSQSKLAIESLMYIMYSGKFFVNNKYRIERNNWNSYLVMFVEQGEMHVKVEKEVYKLFSGDLILLNCYEPHLYYAKKSSSFKWFHFTGTSSHYYFSHLKQKGNLLFENLSKSIIENLVNLILKEGKKQDINEEVISLHLYQLLYELDKNKVNNLHGVIMKAKSFIYQNYHRDISLECIAKSVNLSTYHFARIFKSEVGETPITYLNKVRLNEAKTLLFSTNLSLSEISAKCGYNSDSYFITIFKKYNYYTPTQFRNIEF